jgi:hypothetical protein
MQLIPSESRAGYAKRLRTDKAEYQKLLEKVCLVQLASHHRIAHPFLVHRE